MSAIFSTTEATHSKEERAARRAANTARRAAKPTPFEGWSVAHGQAPRSRTFVFGSSKEAGALARRALVLSEKLGAAVTIGLDGAGSVKIGIPKGDNAATLAGRLTKSAGEAAGAASAD